MKNMNMYRQVYTPVDPFDKEAYINLIQRELHSMSTENARLRREIEELKKNRDIPSAYPGSTFGLVYQECEVRPTFAIDKVLFNPPATIVFWLDGTKTVVKCKEGEEFSEWAGIALCLAKKLYGPNFHKIFKAHCSDPEKPANDMTDEEITKEVRQAIHAYQAQACNTETTLEDYFNTLKRIRKNDAK